MGKFARFAGTEKLLIDIGVDDAPIQVTPVEEDRLRFLGAQEMKGADKYKDLFDLLTDMIHRDMPDEPKEEIRGMVNKRFEKIFLELASYWGLIDKKQLSDFTEGLPKIENSAKKSSG